MAGPGKRFEAGAVIGPKWIRSPNVLWRTAPDFLALATIEGDLIEVSGPGEQIWNLLASAMAFDDLVDCLSVRYGGDSAVISQDVAELLHTLGEGGYVAELS